MIRTMHFLWRPVNYSLAKITDTTARVLYSFRFFQIYVNDPEYERST